ncbi:hypothetical protein V3H47_08515 [Vibrio parahaemolyticus]|uniref:hypothetical protein n=1 Tax=Vibrio TaxID=662 RepID=UPI0019D4CD93|nr:hypothetical protein [Vibrio vulnificus]MBN8112604.1 hypothetical protein [Vibrio vulnificus]
MAKIYKFPLSRHVVNNSSEKEEGAPTLDELLMNFANDLDEEPKKKRKKEKHINRTDNSKSSHVNVKGNNNITGNNNVVINNNHPSKKIERVVIRDKDVLTEAQAYKVKQCVDALVQQEVANGMPKTSAYGKWWGLVKRRYSVTEYKSIPQSKYEDAVHYLQRQAAIKRAEKTVFNEGDREYYYRSIWARSRNLTLSKADVYKIASSIAGENVLSLTHLSLRDLQQLYYKIMSS